MAIPFPKALEDFPVIRQSDLSRFDDCALTWRFSHEYERGWSGHHAARGQIVHRTIAKCLQLMEQEQEPYLPLDVVMSIFDEVIRQADVPQQSATGFSDEVVSLPLREIAQARVDVKCWAMYASWPVDQIAGIEKRLESVLRYPDGEGGHVDRRVSGRLDLLLIAPDGRHATVVDYKSSWGIPSERLSARDAEEREPSENISESGYFQQRMYGLLVLDTYPRVEDVTLQEFYPRYASGKVLDRKGRTINPVREATVNRMELLDIRAEMSALVERFDRAYETRRFRPAPGSHCAYCARPDACTIFPTARKEGRIASQAEAERIAGRLNVLDALKRQTTAALRAWSNAHGDVPVRDAKRPRVYGPVVRRQAVRPDAEAVKRAVARGQDPAELYESRETVEFCVHSPEEVHPAVAAARREEEALVAMERAAEQRRRVTSA